MTEINEPTWPEKAADATADRLIACAALGTIAADAQHHDYYAAVPWGDQESPEYRPAIRRYVESISATVSRAQFAALLVELQKRDPAAAEDAAQLVWHLTDDGGVLVELAWDYLDARGYDAQALADKVKADQENGRRLT